MQNNLVLELGPRAIAQYRKYHPFRVTLSYTNPYQTTAILRMYVEVGRPDELKEIANWLLFLGDDLKVKEMPEEIRAELHARVVLFQD